jgi:hypothetical protein
MTAPDPRQLRYEAVRSSHRESWWIVRIAWCDKMGVDPVTGRWLVEPEEKQWKETADGQAG